MTQPIPSPAIILVRPQMGENIGAAARAMLNFGLTDLRIVAPRDGWPNQAAIDMAAGAFDEMPPPRLTKTLQEASADLQLLFGTTARPREVAKPVYTPAAALTETRNLIQHGGRAGFVFGAERTGLLNDEVAICHALLSVPVNPAFPSLNLAQAVSLIAYEWIKVLDDQSISIKSPAAEDVLATVQETESLFARLEEALDETGFFKTPQQKPTMLRNIRAYLLRGRPTAQETRTFQGIITALRGQIKKPPG